MPPVDLKKLGGQLTAPLAAISKNQKAIDATIAKVDGKLAKLDGALKKVLGLKIAQKHPKAAEPLKKLDAAVVGVRKALAEAQKIEQSLVQIAAQGTVISKGMQSAGDHKKLKEGLIKALAASKAVHTPLAKVEKDVATLMKLMAGVGAVLGALALVTEGATAPVAAELEATALELRSIDKVLKGILLALTGFEKVGDVIVKSL